MPLTILEINQAKTDGDALKLRDKDGLYLRVTKKTKAWRFDFRFDNRRYTLSYGLYPAVSPAKARELHREARQQLAEGINPAIRKRLDKLARSAAFGNSFEATAQHWYDGKQEQRSHAWREAHSLYLRRDLNPYIGDIALSQVDARTLLNVLEKVRTDRGVKTAERVRQTAVAAIFFIGVPGKHKVQFWDNLIRYNISDMTSSASLNLDLFLCGTAS